MPPLPHCQYRRVDSDGAILCDRIRQGDREINADLCRACPVAAIDCALLRATLSLHSRPPIRVRYGNGKTDIWAGEEPTLSMNQAACSEKVIPIVSPHDCSGCHLRQSLSQPHVASPRARVAATPAVLAASTTAAARPARRARPVIELAAWLDKERPAVRSVAPATVTSASRPAMPTPMAEEKRAGWTD